MNEELAGPIHPFAYVWLAFSIWMLIDAARRRAPSYWYFVIVVLPFGALVYFLFVKLQDYRTGSEQGPRPSRTSVSPESIGKTPFTTGTPNLDRADKLEESERYAEAEAIYASALELDRDDKRALHGLGRCLLGQHRARESLAHFERLLELDRDYRNFSAALDYADALWAADQRTDALELLERLADVSGRINHRLALGHYLAEAGQNERARTEIRRAIDEARGSTEARQPRTQQWIERAQSMLEALEETRPSSSPLN